MFLGEESFQKANKRWEKRINQKLIIHKITCRKITRNHFVKNITQKHKRRRQRPEPTYPIGADLPFL